jgi:hypothetical protein
MAIRGRAYINYPLVRPLNLTIHKAGSATIAALVASTTATGKKVGLGTATISATVTVTANGQGTGGATTIGRPTALTSFGPPYILMLPATTSEYIRNTVTAPFDLTTDPVEVALVAADSTPTALQWISASWQGNDIRWLYPGTSTPGVYNYWVRITATPETPVRSTGIVILF